MLLLNPPPWTHNDNLLPTCPVFCFIHVKYVHFIQSFSIVAGNICLCIYVSQTSHHIIIHQCTPPLLVWPSVCKTPFHTPSLSNLFTLLESSCTISTNLNLRPAAYAQAFKQYPLINFVILYNFCTSISDLLPSIKPLPFLTHVTTPGRYESVNVQLTNLVSTVSCFLCR